MASQQDPRTDEPNGSYASATAGERAYSAERVSASGFRGDRSVGGDTSIGTLIGNLLSDTNRLIRDEIRLAKAEAAEKVGQARSGAVSLAIGGALLLLGAIYLIQAIIYALALVMPGWAAALIVGGVIAVIGFVLLKKGQSQLKAQNLAPTRTQENISRDAHMVKESV